MMKPALFLRAVSPLLLLLPVAVPLSAQSQSTAAATSTLPPLQFEVVSIRQREASDTEPSDRKILPGGRFVATATKVSTLIRVAFGTDDNRISGIPAWAQNETFDITATVAGRTEITTPQQFQQLLLSLLEDRFQFKFHREQKEGAVYWLVLDKPGKPGAALKPSPADSIPNMSTNSNGSRTQMHVTNASMWDVAATLQRQAGKPVEDHTDLKGKYDFQIEWSPEETADSSDPSLFTVLKEQLGLKLQPAKGTTEMIVVDGIAHPSTN